jgi:hypothetical protein
LISGTTDLFWLSSWNRVPVALKLGLIFAFVHVMDMVIVNMNTLEHMPHYQLMFRAAVWLILGAAFALELGLRLQSRVIQIVLGLVFIASALWKFSPYLYT